ncbi:MAG: nucleoside 2-deoxyribosyltransferase [Syntrophobacteraceae bacterium]
MACIWMRLESFDVSSIADIVIAPLDGSQVDDGTVWEIGYFYARKSPEQKISFIFYRAHF